MFLSVICLSVWEYFSLSVLNKMLVIEAGIHKMLSGIVNREEPSEEAA